MAPAWQPQMQAMQWVQFPFQTGFPSTMSMLFSGHRFAHLPQETQASETVKPLSLI